MATCSLSNGLNCPTCEELQTKGGNAKNIYVIVRDDLDASDPWDAEANGTITAFNFTAYGFAYKFCSKKLSNGTTQTLTLADNGLKFYVQEIIGKFQQQTQDAKQTIDELKALDDLIVVVENNNGKFEVFGLETGIQITAGVKASGVNIGDDTTYQFTFSQPNGGEESLAPDFFDTDYQTTKNKLESYLA